MHKVYTTIHVSSHRGEIDIAYAGLNFEMAKERARSYPSIIKVWLEGTHIETYKWQTVDKTLEDEKGSDWVKTYDRKENLEAQIKSAHMELQALEAAHILLQEDN